MTIAGLGLAIGVSTAVFTFLNAAVFAPTGIDRPSSAVRVLRATKQGSSTSWPYSEYVQLRDSARQAALEAFIQDTSWLSTTPDVDAAEAAQVHYVSGGFLPTFGGRPSRGRAIEPADDVIGAPPVVVLSHRFWSGRLGADPRIVGQQIWLNGVAVTVVGVSAEKFRGFDDRSPVLWAPIATYHVVDGGRPMDRRSHVGVTVVGRLGDVGRAQAEAQLARGCGDDCLGSAGGQHAGNRRPSPGRRRSPVPRRRVADNAHRDHRPGRHRPRPAARLRERHQPAARQRPLATPRDWRQARTRREPRTPDAAAAHREPVARPGRRSARHDLHRLVGAAHRESRAGASGARCGTRPADFYLSDRDLARRRAWAPASRRPGTPSATISPRP